MAFHKISSAVYIINETLSIPLFTCIYNTFHIEVPLPWTIYSFNVPVWHQIRSG